MLLVSDLLYEPKDHVYCPVLLQDNFNYPSIATYCGTDSLCNAFTSPAWALLPSTNSSSPCSFAATSSVQLGADSRPRSDPHPGLHSTCSVWGTSPGAESTDMRADPSEVCHDTWKAGRLYSKVSCFLQNRIKNRNIPLTLTPPRKLSPGISNVPLNDKDPAWIYYIPRNPAFESSWLWAWIKLTSTKAKNTQS